MQSADILRNAHLSNPATGMPSLALAHSEEISTASSGVSLLHKVLIFCEVPILAAPLLEHQSLLRRPLRKSELPVAG